LVPSSTFNSPDPTKTRTTSSTALTTIKCIRNEILCRSGLRSDDPPDHCAKAPEPMQAIHHRRVPSTTQPGALKVHCDVDNAVGGQHHRRTQQKHPPGFGKPDNLQTAQQNQHEQKSALGACRKQR